MINACYKTLTKKSDSMCIMWERTRMYMIKTCSNCRYRRDEKAIFDRCVKCFHGRREDYWEPRKE